MRKQQYVVTSRTLRKSNEREDAFFDTEAEARQYALTRVKMLQDALGAEFPEEYPNRWLDSTDIRFCAVVIAPYPEKPQRSYVVYAQPVDTSQYHVAGVFSTEEKARAGVLKMIESLRASTGLPFPESSTNRWMNSRKPYVPIVYIHEYEVDDDSRIDQFTKVWGKI